MTWKILLAITSFQIAPGDQPVFSEISCKIIVLSVGSYEFIKHWHVKKFLEA